MCIEIECWITFEFSLSLTKTLVCIIIIFLANVVVCSVVLIVA